MRTALPRKVYRRENRFYRDAGRHLACLRDAGALLQIIDRLLQTREFNTQLSNVLTELRRGLQLARALESLNAERLMATEAEALCAAQKRIADWPLKLGETQLREGVFDSYAQCRTCLSQAKLKATSANFHEWRKQVRYLQDHLKLLKPHDPTWHRTYAGGLKELQSYLCEMQDLAIFQQWLLQLVALGLWQLELFEPLLQRIRERQAGLRALIKPLGEQLYVLRPAAFRKQLLSGKG